jgi:hypothetical protein
VLVVVGCGDNALPLMDAALYHDAPVAPPDAMPDANPLEPEDLLGTGLCVDAACATISADVSAYTPRYALWSDGATKRRWIYIPSGSLIDTTDMDFWQFPQGTKIWKEFTAPDGSGNPVRVETRYIVKLGSGSASTDWYMVAYQWNAANDDATAAPQGAANANGTQHTIPTQADCRLCHERLGTTRILGFGAIQLDATAGAGQVDLTGAIANHWLSNPPSGTAEPYFPFPTDGTTGAIDAVGYMHANCGHCHNAQSAVNLNNNIMMQLKLTVGTLSSVTTTPPYATAIGQVAQFAAGGPANLIMAGSPSTSNIYFRFTSTNSAVRMPPVEDCTKLNDPTGAATLSTWIANLP